MAKARTPESGVPLYKRAGRLLGQSRGADIHLPLPEGGTRDPRLPATARDVAEGYRSVRKLMKKDTGRGKRSNGR